MIPFATFSVQLIIDIYFFKLINYCQPITSYEIQHLAKK